MKDEISALLYEQWVRGQRTKRKPQMQSILVIIGLAALSWSLVALLWSASHG